MNPVLILIDFQRAFESPIWGQRNNLNAENNAKKLLNKWRECSWPIIHIQHTSKNPASLFYNGGKGHTFKEGLEPIESEVVIQKYVNSAFIGTNLKEYLGKSEMKELVIAGLTTQHCVSTTVRMASNYGFDVKLIEDATAAFESKGFDGKNYPAQEVHDIELSVLHDEFATVMRTIDILNSLEADCPY